MNGSNGDSLFGFLDFSSYPLWANLLFFAAAGVLVWIAGTRLSRYADAIADRTGAGSSTVGALLLGGITSLPEVATTVTASLAGDALLAVNNIFGSIAMNVLLLALVAEVLSGPQALTSRIAKPGLMMEGAMSAFVIAIAVAGMIVGGRAIWGISIGAIVTFVFALVAFYLTRRFESRQSWKPGYPEPRDAPAGEMHKRPSEHAEEAVSGTSAEGLESSGRKEMKRKREEVRRLPTGRLVLHTIFAALLILSAGFVASRTGSAISSQTGLGQSFIGAFLVALATSLPEVSTLRGAVLLGNHGMAFSEIFGTNLFDAAILFIVDLADPGAPALRDVGDFAFFAGLLGILLTCVYIAGLAVRARKTWWRLGLDSWAVVIFYFAGAFILYTLR